MQFLVVYDVLDDGWLAGPIVVAVWLLACVIAAFLLRRRRPQASVAAEFERFGSANAVVFQARWQGTVELVRDSAAARNRVPGFLLVVMSLAAVSFGYIAVDAMLQQRRCKEWARTGQYEILEGAVAEYHQGGKESSKQFRVGDWTYSCSACPAGYRGRFTAPDVAPDALHDGVRVRIAHRDGYLLRLEIDATQVRYSRDLWIEQFSPGQEKPVDPRLIGAWKNPDDEHEYWIFRKDGKYRWIYRGAPAIGLPDSIMEHGYDTDTTRQPARLHVGMFRPTGYFIYEVAGDELRIGAAPADAPATFGPTTRRYVRVERAPGM